MCFNVTLYRRVERKRLDVQTQNFEHSRTKKQKALLASQKRLQQREAQLGA